MKLPIRFFSIGLFTAGIISLGFYFFNDNSIESIEDIPVEEMIAKVEEDGYRVISEDEFISFSMYMDNIKQEEAQAASTKTDKEKEKQESKEKDTKEKDDKDKDKEKEKEEENTEEVIKAKFTIKEGDVTPDIADILIEKKIIDDRDKFIKYLEDNDYSPYIQLGTFEVTSDMSLKELAETVTTYPGD